MTMTRRVLFKLAAAIGGVIAIPMPVSAQGFPARPVKFVVPYPPGGTTDLIARLCGQALVPAWGAAPVVENRAGAGTIIGAEAVARSSPDGYTLLVTAEATFAVNPFIFQTLPYSLSDFVPVSGLAVSTHVLVAHPSFPGNTVDAVVAEARRSEGTLPYGTFGPGSSGHLNMEMFAMAAGAKMTPAHYKGAGPMMNDLLAGHIRLAFTGMSLAAGPIQSGKLKPIAIGATSRNPAFTQIPTIAESGLPGFQAISWFGVFAPKGTSEDIVAEINQALQRLLADSRFQAQHLDPAHLKPLTGSPADFTAFVRGEAAKWGGIIKAANISVQ